MSIDLDEEAALRHVTDQLKISYGDRCTPAEVEAAVDEARASFTVLPIRTYVPVLVERRARRILGGDTD
ncbi:three-helix bundle dimerization domain-containing protein [Streptomyces gibsoniae]|uniref:DUF3562 domain-containing protein n=1 Tax=Streptomyces gibsoniae TaxID=3075529 RepID=A0ABU2U2R2_9ACTN|nr:hypothetical protein [Streptomyces sp. DSM 41699]MDT0467400.1 hypothetical protein [Streptomyces sp. DSM 41699]